MRRWGSHWIQVQFHRQPKAHDNSRTFFYRERSLPRWKVAEEDDAETKGAEEAKSTKQPMEEQQLAGEKEEKRRLLKTRKMRPVA